MHKVLLASAAVLALSLSIVPASARAFNITDIVRASDADLNAGLADATANKDAFAMECYAGALAYNAANPKQSLIAGVVGPVSGFQAAREVVKAANSGASLVPPELVQACGPLALDAIHDVNTTALSLFGLKIF